MDGCRVYEVARKHNKPMLVMEPVKGGSLVNLPEDAQKVYDELNQKMENIILMPAMQFVMQQDLTELGWFFQA